MIRLLELRTEKTLSQREVAKLLKVSQATYNNWENERTQPSIEQLIELSKLFSVSVDYLIGNTDEYGTVHAGEALTQEEKGWLKKVRLLDEETRGEIFRLIEKLR